MICHKIKFFAAWKIKFSTRDFVEKFVFVLLVLLLYLIFAKTQQMNFWWIICFDNNFFREGRTFCKCIIESGENSANKMRFEIKKGKGLDCEAHWAHAYAINQIFNFLLAASPKKNSLRDWELFTYFYAPNELYGCWIAPSLFLVSISPRVHMIRGKYIDFFGMEKYPTWEILWEWLGKLIWRDCWFKGG